MIKDKEMVAPDGKGFTVFRGDTARLENGEIKGTLYDIGKSIITAKAVLRPSIGRSWTISHIKRDGLLTRLKVTGFGENNQKEWESQRLL